MSPKRGRPLSIASKDSTLQRRREQTTARVRALRDRRKTLAIATTQPTITQEQQQQSIIMERPLTELDAAETLTQIRLRVQHYTVARNNYTALLQQQALEVNTYHTLYYTKPITTINLQLVNQSSYTSLPILPSTINARLDTQFSLTPFSTSLPTTSLLCSSQNPVASSSKPSRPSLSSIKLEDNKQVIAPEEPEHEEVLEDPE